MFAGEHIMFPPEMHKIGGQMISAPTNPVSVDCVGTGVLDRPLTQQICGWSGRPVPTSIEKDCTKSKNPTNPNLAGCLIFYIEYDIAFKQRILEVLYVLQPFSKQR